MTFWLTTHKGLSCRSKLRNTRVIFGLAAALIFLFHAIAKSKDANIDKKAQLSLWKTRYTVSVATLTFKVIQSR